MMKKFKISTRLMASFLLTAAMTAFIGIYLLTSLLTVDDNSDTVHEKEVIPLGLLVETADKVQEIRIQVLYWRISKTDEARAAAKKAMENSLAGVKDVINKQKDLVVVESEKKPLDDLFSTIGKYVAGVENYMRTTTERCPLSGTTTVDFPPELLILGTEMRESLSAAIDNRINSAEELQKQNEHTAHGAERFAIIALVIILLVSVGLGILSTTSITHPLSTIVDTLSKIEEGNMTIRADMGDRVDSLGRVSRALDSLSSRLQGIFKNLRQDAETLAGSSEELSSIGRQVANTAEENVSQSVTVASTSEQASVNINAMASGAEEASMSASEVASAAEQMSTNMNTIAAAIEEMSASISEISSNANDASKIVNEATVKSSEATSAMGKLGTAAKEIGQVTDVIKKIADKTNLLALNATIEAASAGEAGKGFAVVAGEIKELANQSATSADDIARRIESIQVGTGNAVTVINDVSEIITKINHSVEAISGHVGQQTKASNEIASNVAQANTGSKRVASAIGEVAKGSKDIARNASEAARGSSVVSQNVVSMAQGAKESAQGAKQINQSAGELARIAADLKNILSRFKI